MPSPQLLTSSFQTTATDQFPVLLSGSIDALTIMDPTENNEVTSLHETDDAVAVKIDWQLFGAAVWTTGGTWELALYIDDIDGIGPTSGLLSSATIAVTVSSDPMKYSHTFAVPANTVKPGVYQLVVTINHSPAGGPVGKLTEMVGFAESTPIKFTNTLAESN
jgi:hypothetical protein